MASQSQGIQQLLQAEKRAAEKVSEARKREFRGGAARPRAVVGECGPKPCGVGVWADTVAEACMFRSFMSLSLWKVVGRLKLRCGLEIRRGDNSGWASLLVFRRRVNGYPNGTRWFPPSRLLLWGARSQ